MDDTLEKVVHRRQFVSDRLAAIVGEAPKLRKLQNRGTMVADCMYARNKERLGIMFFKIFMFSILEFETWSLISKYNLGF